MQREKEAAADKEDQRMKKDITLKLLSPLMHYGDERMGTMQIARCMKFEYDGEFSKKLSDEDKKEFLRLMKIVTENPPPDSMKIDR